MNIVIVESPAKAKTINQYLGKDYNVIASYGHIRDLPSKNGSVLPDQDFHMVYEINEKSEKHVKAITQAVKKADTVYLATDPDREGEAIAWHIVEVLKEKKALSPQTALKRITFNEVTKKAILTAIKEAREINGDLVDAQQARRGLDYLFGFTLSPVLWRKLPGSRSAGRVQSVALRLVCEREAEIEQFKTQEYWDVKVDLLTAAKKQFTATLTHLNGQKLEKFSLATQAAAEAAVAQLKTEEWHIADVEKKRIQRSPQPPFTTSSLQQEASRKLGFSAKNTMQIAQKLYEGVAINGETVGLITYMRTDGTYVSADALQAARHHIEKAYGTEYLPKEARLFKSKIKNAQEAHEAIRPTNVTLTPEKAKPFLDANQFKLYELIWKRLVASQMANALYDTVSLIISNKTGKQLLKATGSTLAFDGYFHLYQEGKDDEKDDELKAIPPVTQGEVLTTKKITPHQHFTEPPPRYSEASLVKKLEELGIGRPSTYATILSVLQERDYVRIEKKRFYPQERGRLVTAFLSSFFKQYVQYDFTAQLEDKLDDVSTGQLDWKKLLHDFWHPFYENVTATQSLDFPEVLEALETLLAYHIFPTTADATTDPRVCPQCQNGRLSLKLGKFGAFIACSHYPECRYTKPIGDAATEENSGAELSITPPTSTSLGRDPATGLEVTLRKGPYGYYVQLGEAEAGKGKTKTKPKRATLPSFLTPDDVTLEKALTLLSLPREVGLHPETKEMIKAGFGRFGGYLLYQEKFYSLARAEDVLEIGLNHAVSVIADKAQKSASKTAAVLKNLGTHPKGGEVVVCSGKFGPYLKHQRRNYKLPKDLVPENLTLDQALAIMKENGNK